MANLRRDEIGFVFQESNLLDDFTVFENIALTGYLTNIDRKQVNAKVNELLAQVDMTENVDK
jgi:putative ABC transport system ATP-binding protein